MTNFTRLNFKKLSIAVLAFVLSLGWLASNAQIAYTIDVTAPASVSGKYQGILATAGATPPYCGGPAITGELVLYVGASGNNLACDTSTQDFTGKIVVVQRGTCGFVDKALRAQRKGAIAVIIGNNIAGDLLPSTSAAVTIPSFGITLDDYNKLRPALLAGGVTASLTRGSVGYNADAIWGITPGQGDFNGGLNGWTVQNSSCANTTVDTFPTWRWTANGTARGGNYVGTNPYFGTINSQTPCNGAVAFDSDAYDLEGAGPCYAVQTGSLVSPLIPLPARTPTLRFFSVSFYQAFRQFQSDFYVGWSYDNGATWDSVAINTSYPVNSDRINLRTRVPLVGIPDTATTLRVKFTAIANYYYWIIDDVQIVPTEANNLQVDPFFAVPQNARTPLAYVEPIAFLTDIRNIGGVAQPNTRVNVTIRNAANAVVFTTDRSYGTVPPNTLIENQPFATQFTPRDTGTYTGRYTISSDSTDFDASNNAQTFQFVVGGNVFAKDLAGPTTAVIPAASNWEGQGEAHSWAWGNYYYIPANTPQDYIQSITFGVQQETGSNVAGKELFIAVYEWEDENQDAQADPDERILASYSTYTLTGRETFQQLITVPFPAAGEDPVRLKPNTGYIVMVEYSTEDQQDLRISASSAIDYGAMNLVNDSIGRPRYAGFLGINDDLSEEPYSSIGFGFNFAPVVRMTVGSTPTSTKDLTVLENKFSVFPNPTNSVLNVQLNLDRQAQTATVRLFDVSGKLLNQWSYDNVQQERFQYPVSNLATGTYFLQVVTEQGAGVKKFNVSK